MSSAPTTFIIADNQDITKAGLHHYISNDMQSSAICEVTSKHELSTALINVAGADSVVILDYTAFDIASIDELLILSNRFSSCHWIIFSHELSDNIIYRLSIEPAISIILKESSKEEIISALIYASRHKKYICHQIANLLIAKKPSSRQINLTATETEILKLIALGKSVKEIAAIRISSTHTIITHKKNIFRKISVNNVHEATKYALRAGLIEMIEYYI